MATSTGAFVAGIGTTFVVLAIGFGGGLMMAKSAPHERAQSQVRAASEEPRVPIRVILPTSAEPAQPPQASRTPEPTQQPVPQPVVQPGLQSANQQSVIETADSKKSAETKREAKERELKRRYAERKARRQAEGRARQQLERQQPRERDDAPIMAFSEAVPRVGGGWFGN
jgi:type IV secretory pathway VirB10-like protein